MNDEAAKLLNIYLNDHYLGANGGVALARRVAKNHKDSPFAVELAKLAEDIDGDRERLVSLMKQLDARAQQWRVPAAAAAEKAGRLKLNGYVLNRSPLSSVLEIEALLTGVEAKGAGWRTLRHLAKTEQRLDVAGLDDLIERSVSQIDLLERARIWAIDQAFAAPDPTS
jgi:hypothetical protein